MKKVLWFIVCLMTMVVSANAQNSVVDEFTTNEPTKTGYDHLMLNPQRSIKENYAKIDSLMSLHKENGYAKYYIMIHGDYGIGSWVIGMITIKVKDYERIRPIKKDIIEALVNLYTHSIGKKFNIPSDEYSSILINQTTRKKETGRTFKSQNGIITKEYVEVLDEFSGDYLYWVHQSSPLYKKIYNKVIEETGLKDGGRLYDYDVEQMNNEINSLYNQFNIKSNIPKNDRRSNIVDDIYF